MASDQVCELLISYEELEKFCYRVASVVGLLSIEIFGYTHPATRQYADSLGKALQLTNILRDVREDEGAGRLYLPAEDLERFGCGSDPATAPAAALTALMRFEATRARDWFARGLALLPLLDARSAACVGAMTGIYRRVLGRIEREPVRVLRERVSIPPWEKAWVAARSLAGVGA